MSDSLNDRMKDDRVVCLFPKSERFSMFSKILRTFHSFRNQMTPICLESVKVTFSGYTVKESVWFVSRRQGCTKKLLMEFILFHLYTKSKFYYFVSFQVFWGTKFCLFITTNRFTNEIQYAHIKFWTPLIKTKNF